MRTLWTFLDPPLRSENKSHGSELYRYSLGGATSRRIGTTTSRRHRRFECYRHSISVSAVFLLNKFLRSSTYRYNNKFRVFILRVYSINSGLQFGIGVTFLWSLHLNTLGSLGSAEYWNLNSLNGPWARSLPPECAANFMLCRIHRPIVFQRTENVSKCTVCMLGGLSAITFSNHWSISHNLVILELVA